MGNELLKDLRASSSSLPTFFDSVIRIIVGGDRGIALDQAPCSSASNTPGDVVIPASEQNADARDGTRMQGDAAIQASDDNGASESPRDDKPGAESSYDNPRVNASKDSKAEHCEEAATESTQGVQFWAHEGLLCDRSVFFKQALNGKWKESDDKVVRLPDDDPKIFAIYLASLYSGLLHVDHDWTLLCELYVLAEKLQDSKSRDDVIDALHLSELNVVNFVKPSDLMTINYVYYNTPESCVLRRLLTRLWVTSNADIRELEASVLTDIHKDFFIDLTTRLMEVKEGALKRHWSPEEYYLHEATPKQRPGKSRKKGK